MEKKINNNEGEKISLSGLTGTSARLLEFVFVVNGCISPQPQVCCTILRFFSIYFFLFVCFSNAWRAFLAFRVSASVSSVFGSSSVGGNKENINHTPSDHTCLA